MTHGCAHRACHVAMNSATRRALHLRAISARFCPLDIGYPRGAVNYGANGGVGRYLFYLDIDQERPCCTIPSALRRFVRGIARFLTVAVGVSSNHAAQTPLYVTLPHFQRPEVFISPKSAPIANRLSSKRTHRQFLQKTTNKRQTSCPRNGATQCASPRKAGSSLQ